MLPDERGRFGSFGGRYVPEILIPPWTNWRGHGGPFETTGPSVRSWGGSCATNRCSGGTCPRPFAARKTSERPAGRPWAGNGGRYDRTEGLTKLESQPGCWNWFTGSPQKRLGFGPCGFESRPRHVGCSRGPVLGERAESSGRGSMDAGRREIGHGSVISHQVGWAPRAKSIASRNVSARPPARPRSKATKPHRVRGGVHGSFVWNPFVGRPGSASSFHHRVGHPDQGRRPFEITTVCRNGRE